MVRNYNELHSQVKERAVSSLSPSRGKNRNNGSKKSSRRRPEKEEEMTYDLSSTSEGDAGGEDESINIEWCNSKQVVIMPTKLITTTYSSQGEGNRSRSGSVDEAQATQDRRRRLELMKQQHQEQSMRSLCSTASLQSGELLAGHQDSNGSLTGSLNSLLGNLLQSSHSNHGSESASSLKYSDLHQHSSHHDSVSDDLLKASSTHSKRGGSVIGMFRRTGKNKKEGDGKHYHSSFSHAAGIGLAAEEELHNSFSKLLYDDDPPSEAAGHGDTSSDMPQTRVSAPARCMAKPQQLSPPPRSRPLMRRHRSERFASSRKEGRGSAMLISPKQLQERQQPKASQKERLPIRRSRSGDVPAVVRRNHSGNLPRRVVARSNSHRSSDAVSPAPSVRRNGTKERSTPTKSRSKKQGAYRRSASHGEESSSHKNRSSGSTDATPKVPSRTGGTIAISYSSSSSKPSYRKQGTI